MSMRSTPPENPPRRPQSENISPSRSRLSLVGRSSLEENLAQRSSPNPVSVLSQIPLEDIPDESDGPESNGNAEAMNEVLPLLPDEIRPDTEESEYEDCDGNDDEEDAGDDRDSRLMSIIPEEGTFIGNFLIPTQYKTILNLIVFFRFDCSE